MLMIGSTNHEASRERRGAFVARLGALTQIIFATLIGGVSALAGDRSPDFVPRPLLLAGLFALPGVVGLLGIRRERAGVVIAAAGASATGAFIAFSGVTLIFLAPAALMAIGSARLAGGRLAGPRDIALRLARAVLATALMLAAGWSALLVTDRACYVLRETQGGMVVEPTAFATGELSVPADASGVGCSEGLISARGFGLGLLLGGGAIAVAGLPARRRRT
jgi:hypothetical protein